MSPAGSSRWTSCGGRRPLRSGSLGATRSALTDAGVPCTVGELKERFEAFLADLTKAKDAPRVRVVLER
jgi:hypothetical protein